MFITASRLTCHGEGSYDVCPPLNGDTTAGTVDSWEPYRCCTEYSVSFRSMNIAALHYKALHHFITDFFQSILNPFVINLAAASFLALVM